MADERLIDFYRNKRYTSIVKAYIKLQYLFSIIQTVKLIPSFSVTVYGHIC